MPGLYIKAAMNNIEGKQSTEDYNVVCLKI